MIINQGTAAGPISGRWVSALFRRIVGGGIIRVTNTAEVHTASRTPRRTGTIIAASGAASDRPSRQRFSWSSDHVVAGATWWRKFYGCRVGGSTLRDAAFVAPSGGG